MPQPVYILFGAGWTALTATLLGLVVFDRLGLRLARMERAVLAFLTGASVLSLLVFLLSALHLARKGVFLALGLLAIAEAARRGLFRPASQRLPPVPRAWAALFVAVFAVFGALYLVNAMAPEASPDGSGYHLGLVSRYARERGFHRITDNMYASLSQGVEMLFLYAYAFGRHSAAACVHLSFLIALPLAMIAYARRFGFPGTGAAGALFFFCSPVAGIDGASAYNDVAAAAVLFGVFHLLEIWRDGGDDRLLAPAGLLAGFAYATKYTAFLAVPYALAVVMWRSRSDRRALLRRCALVACCAAVVMSPWLVKNAVWVGNPLAPFFNSVFPNPYVHVAFEKEYAASMRNYEGLSGARAIPLEASVRGEVLGGVVGPLFLLTPVAGLALREPAGRRLLAAALLFGSTYAANIGTRFLLPPLPFVSLALALAVRNSWGVAPGLVLFHALSAWPALLGVYVKPQCWRLRDAPVWAAMRQEPEDAFLASRLPGYPIARLIEQHVPPSARVFTFTPIPEAYTARNVLVSYQAASNWALRHMLLLPLIPDWQPAAVWSFPVQRQALRRLRVVQTARASPDQWSVAECRIYDGGRELPRLPGWRLRARPNPWEVRSAFDNSPVTQWISGRWLEPGMSLEVDFGRPQTLDRVTLECSPDQHKIHLRLEGATEDGVWKTLSDAAGRFEIAPPEHLRRQATVEASRRGVDYLVVWDFDYGAADFRSAAAIWGIREIGERAGARLYRISPAASLPGTAGRGE